MATSPVGRRSRRERWCWPSRRTGPGPSPRTSRVRRMTGSTYRLWGWGGSDRDAPRPADVDAFGAGLAELLGFPGQSPERPSPLRALAEPAVALPASLAGLARVDPVARAARLRAGTAGPDVERGLAGTGLTLRFFPQSFERSTVGGWIATRAAGHYAARLQHVDDLVESVRAVTPAGVWESRRLPGSAAGPSPDRLLLGSEGVLGVLTEAWLRLQAEPVHRARAVLAAADLAAGATALRALVQAGLAPATCRLVDPVESALTGALGSGEAALVLGAESAVGPVDAELAAAVSAAADLGLRPLPAGESAGAGDAWRAAFLRGPYLRELLVLCGVLV